MGRSESHTRRSNGPSYGASGALYPDGRRDLRQGRLWHSGPRGDYLLLDGGSVLGRGVVRGGFGLVGPARARDAPGRGGLGLRSVRTTRVPVPRRPVSRRSSGRRYRPARAPEGRHAHAPPPPGTSYAQSPALGGWRGRGYSQRPRATASHFDTVPLGERLEAGAQRLARGSPLHADARAFRKHRRGRGAHPRVRGKSEVAGSQNADARCPCSRPGIRSRARRGVRPQRCSGKSQYASTAVLTTSEASPEALALASRISLYCGSAPGLDSRVPAVLDGERSISNSTEVVSPGASCSNVSR